MVQERPPLLTAVVICILLTGTAAVYALLAGDDAPGQPPVPAGTPAQGTSRTFSIDVYPASTTARPGETIRYTLTIHPEGGFAEPIEVTVSATALGGVYREDRDLGTIAAPYPPLTNEITVPGLPPLVSTATVDAVITARGGGIVRTGQVRLVIRR